MTHILLGRVAVRNVFTVAAFLSALLIWLPGAFAAESKFADHDGVKIHYIAEGKGPLAILIHGFPDYAYTWRHLTPLLKKHYRVAAVDLRGYNLSDSPEGVENYAMPVLIGDILAVMRAEGAERATLIGHDWGAAIAWQMAINAPGAVDRLVILSVPHPVGLARELATNKQQQEDSQYARDFQAEGAEDSLTAEGLASWVEDQKARKKYIKAFKRSDFTAMLNYYRANYPRDAAAAAAAAQSAPPPKIKAPVLVIHGVKDKALNAAGHNGTWDWVEQDTTLLMLPEADHFVQHDAPELVNRTIMDWLSARR